MAEFLMEDGEMAQPENVRLSEDGKAVVILDQTQLPNVTEFLTLDTPKKMYDAIFELQVRGAPAIRHLCRILHVCALRSDCRGDERL